MESEFFMMLSNSFVSRLKVFFLIVLSLSLCGCGDEDGALIKKNQDLRTELNKQNEKVALLKASIAQDPGDQTKALNKVNKELEKALHRLKKLDNEKEKLELDHIELEKEFRDYQEKYKIK